MFEFKQFKVADSHSAQKVCTDSVLLGSWCRVPQGCTSMLDLGAGCGLLALMLAQRCPSAIIRAIEIDPGACSDAAENALQSAWTDRIEVICADANTLTESYHLIICNPPFFNETLQSPIPFRAIARHGQTLTVDSMLALASRLLTPDGILAFIAPTSRDAEIEFAIRVNRLHTLRTLRMRQRTDRPLVRTLREVSPMESATVPETTEITLYHPDKTPTDEYRLLTRDFYLQF